MDKGAWRTLSEGDYRVPQQSSPFLQTEARGARLVGGSLTLVLLEGLARQRVYNKTRQP